MFSICSGCGKKLKLGTNCACKKQGRRQYKRQYEKDNSELTKMLKSARWKKFRRFIIKRDGGTCQRCLIKYNIIETKNPEVHHIIPRSEQPELMYDENNVVTLCKTCNLQLGTSGIDFDFKPQEKEYFL